MNRISGSSSTIIVFIMIIISRSYEIDTNITEAICDDCNITLSTFSIRGYEGKKIVVDLNISCDNGCLDSTVNLNILDNQIAKIKENETSIKLLNDEECFFGNFTIQLIKVGKTELIISSENCQLERLEIFVLKEKSNLSLVFLITLVVLLVLTNIGIGLKVQLKLLLKLLKKPAAPLICIIWQFIVMAPLSFALAKGLQLDAVFAIGLLAIGCSPGGGTGNIFAILLDADMELALLMNLTGLIASLATAPIWIWLLKPYLEAFETTNITISVQIVFLSLAAVLFPVAIAMAITFCQPKVSKFLQKVLKPCLIVIGLAFFALGVAVYFYVIPFLQWKVYIAAFLLPFIGYMTSGMAAYILKSGKERAITVGCMVGFQNVGLAMMMLRLSLAPPDDDIGGAVPIVYMIMGGSLPTIVILIRQTHLQLEKRRKNDQQTNDELSLELKEKSEMVGKKNAAESNEGEANDADPLYKKDNEIVSNINDS